ncbi:hypothetical protein BITS_1841 [Bifidobacterium tsurumiense]|uniref:Uncharacterized protein n=1 Tax=Bifidobacterium tsurumiense TaxID=356829 RepID=A0A087EE24_9BIFI|nr:hypothetical protein BITS_1841 [Bifidobacterium tsurumiense]
MANQLLGIGNALDEMAIHTTGFQQSENNRSNVIVEAALAFYLGFFLTVAGSGLIHILDPENVRIIG